MLQRGDVQIRGDAELAQKFRELALLLRPDLEEELSQCHRRRAGPSARPLRARRVRLDAQRRCSTTVRNVAEYLAHERRDLVPRAEGDQLLKGVDALREDVDRLEARIELLAQKARVREAARARPPARDPARAAAARAGRLRPRHPSVPAAAFRLLPLAGLWFARRRGATRGERLRLALEELGPIFVKFGQAVSTRRDLLPPDIADELAKLQDRVPPFPGDVARADRRARATASPSPRCSRSSTSTPLAAASIAQVHAAQLPRRQGSRRQGAAARTCAK